MSLAVQTSAQFRVDFEDQFGWYLQAGGEETARKFQAALDSTVATLAQHPGLGRKRSFRHRLLDGIRSFRVQGPFSRILIFYRVDGDGLRLVRLMDGSRDLPQRLREE